MPDDLEEDALPCADKARYPSPKEAKAAMVLATHRHGAKLYYYKCNYCDLWHLATDFS